ncbi:hypothetical protein B0H15DRAFT_972036 [Mycena belliarum]|uniref:Ferric oxidoreductase domain-containing protein n=1 Tax=Mycena belliarum TaxID=1033014 RepID=A0AAD6TR29_9AGAR|nr:hypothetical protein B0H15DRAFT_972036 [Mycena belliae]
MRTHLVVAVYAAFALVCIVVQAPLMISPNRAGFLALAQLPPVFLFAAKNSPLTALLLGPGTDYTKLNYVHRWSVTPRTLTLAALIHWSLWINNHLVFALPILSQQKEGSGVATLACLLVVALSSAGPVRRRLWGVFLAGHYLAFPAFFITLCYHTIYATPWIFPPLAFFPYFPPAWQHVQLRAAFGARAWEAHPLSVACAPPGVGCLRGPDGEPLGILLAARACGDWTRALHDFALMPEPALDLDFDDDFPLEKKGAEADVEAQASAGDDEKRGVVAANPGKELDAKPLPGRMAHLILDGPTLHAPDYARVLIGIPPEDVQVQGRPLGASCATGLPRWTFRSPRESHTLSISLSIAALYHHHLALSFASFSRSPPPRPLVLHSHDLLHEPPPRLPSSSRSWPKFAIPGQRQRPSYSPSRPASPPARDSTHPRAHVCRPLRIAFFSPQPPRSRSRPYSQQILDLIATPDLYVREGLGFVYVCGRVDNTTLAAYRAGHITRAEFLDRLLIKIGHAQFLDVRQRAYEKCDDGQTHLWFFSFYPTRRIVSERLCHLRFLADGALRVIEECRGCLVRHREYWRYRDVGPFSRIEQQTRRVFASLGEPGLPRDDLADVAVAFPTRPTCNRQALGSIAGLDIFFM